MKIKRIFKILSPAKPTASVCMVEYNSGTVGDGAIAHPQTMDYTTPTLDNDCAKGLMQLISQALDQWAVEYKMENLPKKIVFQQALSIMTAMDEIYFK